MDTEKLKKEIEKILDKYSDLDYFSEHPFSSSIDFSELKKDIFETIDKEVKE